MRIKRWLTIVVIFLLAGCTRGSEFEQALRNIPCPSVHYLSNGMTVFLLEDHSLPTFRLSLLHPAGSAFEEKNKIGLAAVTAEIIRTGGTEQLPAEEVDRRISDSSASIELEAEREAASISLRVLSEDRRKMLELLTQMLKQPRFDPVSFEVARRQAQMALRRAKENPAGISDLYFRGVIYGVESPWAAVPTEETLAGLNVEDARGFYQDFYYPDRMILGVAGDFAKKEMLAELEATLGSWKKTDLAELNWPEVSERKRQDLFIGKDAVQVAVRVGHLGKQRTDPDKFPVLVANFILGGSGSMTSRLGREIRSTQGQAYSVWSRYGFERVPGVFEMVAQTEASQLTRVVTAMRKILMQMRDQGVTETDVEDAKKAILRSLLFAYESRYGIVNDQVRFAFWGYPRDYMKIFAEGIGQVDVEAVNRVLRDHFHPDKLSLLIVGPEYLWPKIQKQWPGVQKGKV